MSDGHPVGTVQPSGALDSGNLPGKPPMHMGPPAHRYRLALSPAGRQTLLIVL